MCIVGVRTQSFENLKHFIPLDALVSVVWFGRSVGSSFPEDASHDAGPLQNRMESISWGGSGESRASGVQNQTKDKSNLSTRS